jgi:hypothetical protein
MLVFANTNAVSYARTRCIKQECASALQRLQQIRIDQERRDKLLDLKFRVGERKRKWNEFDINVASTLNYARVSFTAFNLKPIA